MCTGMGITALFFGYTMMKRNDKRSILFIEQQNRIGGRLTSLQVGPVRYMAEGCALRYFPVSSPILDSLLKELGIGSVPMPNDRLQTPDTYVSLLRMLREKYPPDGIDKLLYTNISFPDALLDTTGDKDSVRIFSSTIGHQVFRYPINLDMAYRALLLLTQDMQYLIEGGYISLCTSLYRAIQKNDRYHVSFGERIHSVQRRGNCFIVNGRIRCKKFIFTGTRDQLNSIRFSTDIEQLKIPINRLFFDYRAFRIYLSFLKPWWKRSEILYRFASGSPVNSIQYFTEDTITIYSGMQSADFLCSLLPPDYRESPFKWYPSTELPVLVSFLIQEVKRIIGRDVPMPYRIAYKYTKQAAQFARPVPSREYRELYSSFNSYEGFYMLGADWTINPGWVESCLSSVLTNIANI